MCNFIAGIGTESKKEVRLLVEETEAHILV
jgi:hypothetical protein